MEVYNCDIFKTLQSPFSETQDIIYSVNDFKGGLPTYINPPVTEINMVVVTFNDPVISL